MAFSGEKELVQIEDHVFAFSEQEVEVFEGLGKDKRVEPVFLFAGADIVDGGIAARHAGVLLQAFQDVFAHLEVVGVVGGDIEEVGGFDEFGAERVVAPVNLEVRCKCFWYELVSLHNL